MRLFQILPHQADFKIKILGKNLKGLFENSFFALAEILNAGSKTHLKKLMKASIKIKSQDSTTLLIDFLNEILANCQIKKAIFNKLKIKELSEKEVQAEIFGKKVVKFKKDIKAATYHQAEIKKSKNGLAITVIFDI